MNEVQGCVLNNLIISIIDLIVRNNIENLFGLNKEEGKRKKKKKKRKSEAYYTLNLQQVD